MSTPPDLNAVKAYLGSSNSYTDAELQSALDAETEAQKKVCKIPFTAGAYPTDLAEALCRRVHRNLALRNLPLELQSSIADGAVATNRVGGTGAEVARLERPYRKLVFR